MKTKIELNDFCTVDTDKIQQITGKLQVELLSNDGTIVVTDTTIEIYNQLIHSTDTSVLIHDNKDEPRIDTIDKVAKLGEMAERYLSQSKDENENFYWRAIVDLFLLLIDDHDEETINSIMELVATQKG